MYLKRIIHSPIYNHSSKRSAHNLYTRLLRDSHLQTSAYNVDRLPINLCDCLFALLALFSTVLRRIGRVTPFGMLPLPRLDVGQGISEVLKMSVRVSESRNDGRTHLDDHVGGVDAID